MKKGTVFNIQKCSVNDGPGIRTTVFLKGCPLNCLWCHNPESKKSEPQVMLFPSKCVGCGECVKTCPEGLHSFGPDGTHNIRRSQCLSCGTCTANCVGALEMCGKQMTTKEVLEQVLADKVFYEHSGGGMTLSGGEPLFQPAFTLELLKKAKEQGLHTCIETCGFAPWHVIEAVKPYVDLFLWDVKETDSTYHRKFTGVPNEPILENLRKLDAAGAKIVLRCPIIPGCNDRPELLQAIGQLAESLHGVQRIDVSPYHPLGKSKSEALDIDYALGELSFTEEETVQSWIKTIAAHTSVQVCKT